MRKGAGSSARPAIFFFFFSSFNPHFTSSTHYQLMAAHVDLLAPNHLGQTAVHAAIMRGSVTVLEKLAEIGAPLNTPDRFGRTPMQLACLHRWPVVCFALNAMKRASMLSLNDFRTSPSLIPLVESDCAAASSASNPVPAGRFRTQEYSVRSLARFYEHRLLPLT